MAHRANVRAGTSGVSTPSAVPTTVRGPVPGNGGGPPSYLVGSAEAAATYRGFTDTTSGRAARAWTERQMATMIAAERDSEGEAEKTDRE